MTVFSLLIIDKKGCYAAGEVSNSNLDLRIEWYSDTIINNPKQFKLDGIYVRLLL